MDALEALKDAIKGAETWMKESKNKMFSIENDIASLNAKKALLEKDVSVLQEKYDGLETKIKDERKAILDEIEKRNRQSSDLKASIEAEVFKLRQKEVEIATEQADLDVQKREIQSARENLASREEILAKKLEKLNILQESLK